MSRTAAKPKYETKPTPRSRSWHREIEAAAARLGTPFMPWQKKAGRLIGELSSELCRCHNPGRPLPRRKTVIISVPRQSGKTTITRGATAARADQEGNLRMFGTAQSRLYAVRHLENLALALGSGVVSRLGVGNEKIVWPNDSRYEVIAPTDSGGHGDSIDWMVVDEGWKLSRHTLGGLRPAMAARPHSQMLIISTMGTVDSDVWNELVLMGRESIEDPNSTIGYLEYSAPDESAVFEESRWSEWMPALGHTLSVPTIREDMKILSPQDFTRAYGNLTVASLSIVFPEEWVDRSWVAAMEPPERLVLAVDVNSEPPGAAITSGHLASDGIVGIRTLEWRFGSPSWVTQTVDTIIRKRSVEAVVGDFGGPARALLAELTSVCENRGVPLVDRKPRELGGDTAGFYDALRESAVALERNEHLEAAIRGAYRKSIGDLWVPHRKRMLIDASPLMGAIMSYGMAREFALAPRLPAIW